MLGSYDELVEAGFSADQINDEPISNTEIDGLQTEKLEEKLLLAARREQKRDRVSTLRRNTSKFSRR